MRTQLKINSAYLNYSVAVHAGSPWTFLRSLLKNNVLLIDSVIFSANQAEFFDFPEKAILSIDASEHFKTLAGVVRVLDFLVENALTKDKKLIIVGGGTLQETGAFASKIYKRGIQWIYFPTTLIAMSDSCIGGKAGINYAGAKNQLGVFSSPAAIHIFSDFLNTLPETQIRSGLGEILKSCIIGGDYFLNQYHYFFQRRAFTDLIMIALSIKKTVVEHDEFEKNHRRCLNYGHTFGHAIEILSDYKIPHGIAVVLGIQMANKFSYQQRLLSLDCMNKLNTLCESLISPTDHQHFRSIELSSMTPLFHQDKKTVDQHTHFVLIKKPGEIVYAVVDPLSLHSRGILQY